MKHGSANPKSKSSMSLAIIDRRNNSTVSGEPVEDSQNPQILPAPDTAIWHYIRFDYFKELLKNNALWLTRLDKQSDEYDGMYSEANSRQWTPTIQKLLDKAGFTVKAEKNDETQLQWTNQILRQRAFIHCWSIRSKESALMWNLFVPNDSRSIAIRSTVGRLSSALEGQPVEILRMLYVPAGQPRPDWSYTAPFSAKDKAAHLHERKLRVWTLLDSAEAENADHKLISVNLKKLIGKVVVHPASSQSFRLEVRDQLKSFEIPVHIACSQLREYDLRAVMQNH
jgi:hypothetical protein